MRFVREGDLLNVEVIINRCNWGNLVQFATIKQRIDGESGRYNASDSWHYLVQLKLHHSKQDKFEDELTNMLISNFNLTKLNKADISRQKEELVFIAGYLEDLDITNLYHRDDSADFKTFRQLLDVLNAQSQLNNDDGIKITFLQNTISVNPSIELPKAPNTLELYEYICNAIYQYYVDTAKTFELKWYLFNGYKEPRTLALLNDMANRVSNKPKPNGEDRVGLYINTLLPYLRMLPQFPPKSRKVVITGPQAEFIDRYFTLFGLYGDELRVNMKPYVTTKSPRQLRAILARFLKKFYPNLE